MEDGRGNGGWIDEDEGGGQSNGIYRVYVINKSHTAAAAERRIRRTDPRTVQLNVADV